MTVATASTLATPRPDALVRERDQPLRISADVMVRVGQQPHARWLSGKAGGIGSGMNAETPGEISTGRPGLSRVKAVRCTAIFGSLGIADAILCCVARLK